MDSLLHSTCSRIFFIYPIAFEYDNEVIPNSLLFHPFLRLLLNTLSLEDREFLT